jgi:hypothetical protein
MHAEAVVAVHASLQRRLSRAHGQKQAVRNCASRDMHTCAHARTHAVLLAYAFTVPITFLTCAVSQIGRMLGGNDHRLRHFHGSLYCSLSCLAAAAAAVTVLCYV